MANDTPGVEPIRALAIEPSIDGSKVVYTTVEARSDNGQWHYQRCWHGYHSTYVVTHINTNRKWVFPTLLTARRWTHNHGRVALEVPDREFL